MGNALAIAVKTLWAHKLRSALTVFGIVVGIASVVLIGATLKVVREMAVQSTAQTIGADTFIISKVGSAGSLSRKQLEDKLRKNPEIYRREAEILGERLKDDALAALTLDAIADVRAGNKTFLAASITGATASVQAIRNIRLSSGRFYTEAENRRSLRVAVIGQDVADAIALSTDPLGKSIRIKGQAFRVIGVQEKQGSSFGSSLDRSVYMPLLAFEKIWGSRRSVTVSVQPRDSRTFAETQEQARVAMRILRRLKAHLEQTDL